MTPEGKGASGKPSSSSSSDEGTEEKLPLSDDKLVWTKAETKEQIKRLENRVYVAYKQHINEVQVDGLKADDVKKELESAKDSFSEEDFVKAYDSLIDCKNDLRVLISKLSPWRKCAYFISIWAIVPILYAVVIGLIGSFIALKYFGDMMIMGVVPVWASLVAVIGGSVQILVGVVKDYKEDDMITDYRRLWYVVLLPVSFAFGFIAFLLIQAGLITVSQGQFIINPSFNQTLTSGLTTQTATTGPLKQATTYGLALPLILCFLAGYATDWFMGLLGKLTPTSESEKK
jgi:hypothetical protein